MIKVDAGIWDVERLVTWALRDQGLGWVGKEREQLDFSDYGTIIDDDGHGSHPTIGLLSDEDATRVKDAIDRLPFEARVLVIQYGRAGCRPPFGEEGIGRPRQLRNRRGQPMWDYAEPGNRRSAKTAKLDYLAHSVRRERIKAERAEYRVWWEALLALVEPLNNVLMRHRARGPDCSREPWRFVDDDRQLPDSAEDDAEDDVESAEPGHPAEAAELARHEMTADELRSFATAHIHEKPRDWGAPGTGFKPSTGRLTVEYVEPAKPSRRRPKDHPDLKKQKGA